MMGINLENRPGIPAGEEGREREEKGEREGEEM